MQPLQAGAGAPLGTQFTCFTSTKVQIQTPGVGAPLAGADRHVIGVRVA
jgi:hypothetical protein